MVVLACSIPRAFAEDNQPGEPVGETMPLGHRAGSPFEELPVGTYLVSSFGERPVFSPDGTRLAFIGKSYGDAFEYDIASGSIRNLTAHMPHQGILRVHYLSDGSFLLLAPHVLAETREETRFARIELWWMDAAASRPAVRLGARVWEGLAVSATSNLVAWSEASPAAARTRDAATATTLKVGRVVVKGGAVRLDDVRAVASRPTSDCMMEAQDFLPGDKGMTLPCYRLMTNRTGPLNDVLSLDFVTGKFTRYPTRAGLYGEVEGIFPDGKRTLVECSGDRSSGMDICLLELKPIAPRYTRLTRIMDFGRYKYGNPVVRRDGRMIAAQIGSADVAEPGVGQGIVLMELPSGF